MLGFVQDDGRLVFHSFLPTIYRSHRLLKFLGLLPIRGLRLEETEK